MPSPTPEPAVKEAWRVSRQGRTASCELRDDTGAGAGWEVLVRHDDEIILGRRCENEPMAGYYANAFCRTTRGAAGKRKGVRDESDTV